MPRMKVRMSALSVGLLNGFLSLPAYASESQEIELYVDPVTQQVYAQPGKNRLKMGKFKQVSNESNSEPAVEPQLATREQPVTQKLEKPVSETQKIEKPLSETKKPVISGVQIRGYVQTRYSQMVSGDKGADLWSDRSVGDKYSLQTDKNFLIRRARLVFSGNVGDHLGFYIQPDFSSSASTTNNVVQLRDAYGDIFLDKSKVHRFRVGQSKVPFGFENLQSSQNRLALDRADALNSGVRDERDTGVFYYYTPSSVQNLFSAIQKDGLKHTGDYGLFGFGAYNGQGGNRRDENSSMHLVSRLSYPIKDSTGQFYEFGVQGYSGKYVSSIASYNQNGTVRTTPNVSPKNVRDGIKDERVGISAIMYPQPFGLQAEWNWGTTPGLDQAQNVIEAKSFNGGYVQAMYMYKTANYGNLMPFVKWQYFDGYNKAETNSPRNKVNDIELGVEWQVIPAVELTAVYHRMNRNNLITGNREDREDYSRFDADALRIQLQYNF